MKIIALVIISLFSIQLRAQHVAFGERDQLVHANNLFFDKEGILYPPFFIDDDSLKKYNYSLKHWYANHLDRFDSLFDAHVKDAKQNGSFYNRVLLLNRQLLHEKASGIQSAEGRLLIAIHGFRKSFFQQNNDVTSVKEFDLLHEDLRRHSFPETPHIDVYWDAMYDCCFSTDFKRNDYLFSLFDTALIQADQVGRSLQTFLSKLSVQEIDLIAHSLGTRVAVKSLENLEVNGTIKIAFIAAAIPGSDISEAILDKRLSNKIQWLVYYNENDFVLQKKDPKIGLIGPGSYHHGITTLGSNKKKDALKTAKAINKFDSSIVFQLHNANAVGKCHSLRCYTKAQFLLPMVQFFLD